MDKKYLIHTTDESQVEHDANTELNKDLGLVSYSLWCRNVGSEYPLLIQSQQPCFLSHNVEYSDNSTEQELTEQFIESVSKLFDEDFGGGFGGVDESVWEEMPKIEQVIFSLIRQKFADEKYSDELVKFHSWCQRQ